MPTLVVVGLTHHSAPLEIRERVAFNDAKFRSVAPTSFPSVLVSTCNRVQVYAYCTGRTASAIRALEGTIATAAGCRRADLAPYLLRLSGQEALLHLVRVAAGLDSLVVGEDQIRGQLRDAWQRAEPTPLSSIFQRAAESARRVRSGTRLNKVPSIAAAGVHVAQRMLPTGLAGQGCVVLGAGVVARAAAEHLALAGARVLVLNRTPEHAATLVAHLGHQVRAGALTDLPAALREVTLVVGATASRAPVVSAAMLRDAMAQRELPLLALDVAVPRDIEPAARGIPGVTLIDLDDLERECPLDVPARQAEIDKAEGLAIAEADRLGHWLRLRSASPAIAELRSFAEDIRLREMRRSAVRLRDLTPEQAAAVEALTTGIVNKLLHGPTVALRDAATAAQTDVRRSHSRILRVLRPGRGRTPA
jgi:glutamyl-tRNA reductase